MASNPNLSQPNSRKQVKSEGNGVPSWLQSRGVGAGEFYQGSKPSLRTVMKDSRWQDTARVYACVSLHTVCYGSKLGNGPGPLLAIRLERNEPVSLRPVDIEKETGIERRSVRRAVASLVKWGYLIRDGENILLWLIPEATVSEPEAEPESQPGIEFPDDLPDDLLRYLKKFRVSQMPSAEVLEQAKPLCSSLVETESLLRHLLVPEKPKLTGGESKAGAGVKRSSSRAQRTYQEKAKVSPNGNNGNGVNGLDPRVHLERNERKTTKGDGSSSSKAEPNATTTIPTPDLALVSTELKRHCQTNPAIVNSLVMKCREAAPHCTAVGIVEALKVKGPLARSKNSPVGFLMVAIPDLLISSSALESTVPVLLDKKSRHDSTMAFMLDNIKKTGRLL